MTAARGLTLATAVWMIDRVHGDTTRLRAHALPPLATGLTDLDELVL
jgi:hypothetical protein